MLSSVVIILSGMILIIVTTLYKKALLSYDESELLAESKA